MQPTRREAAQPKRDMPEAEESFHDAEESDDERGDPRSRTKNAGRSDVKPKKKSSAAVWIFLLLGGGGLAALLLVGCGVLGYFLWFDLKVTDTQRVVDLGGNVNPNGGKPDGDRPAGQTKTLAARLSFDSKLEGGVKSVSVSPDGKYIVSAGTIEKENVQIWDVADQKRIHAIDSIGGFMPVAIAPDGKTFAHGTGGLFGGIAICELPSGKKLRVLNREPGLGAISTLAFSPQGDLLIVAANDDLVGFNPNTGEQRFEWKGDGKGEMREVSALSQFFDGGRKIVSAGINDRVKIWDVATGTAEAVSVNTKQKIVSLAVSPDGKTLAVVALWDKIEICDLSTRKTKKTLEARGGWLPALFLPDNVTLVYGADYVRSEELDKHEFTLANVMTGARTHVLRGHTKHSWSAALMGDGSMLVTGSEDGTIKLWDLKSLP
jgi:WD40 repeat protein